MAASIREEARDIPVIAEVDVLVVGGGPAGVAAAVGAAREGARTFLIERHGFLGGMWTAGMVLTLAGYNCWLRPYHRCVGGIAAEWLARAAAEGGAEDNEGWVLNSDPETMKRVADAMITEAGVGILLHTWGARPILDGGRVGGAYVENVDGRSAITARVTIDCTGNGDILARAGAPWTKSASLQPMTMPFRIGGVATSPAVDIAAPARIPFGPEPGFLPEPLLSDYASRRRDIAFDAAAMRAEAAAGRLPRFGGPWFGGLEKDTVWVNSTRIYGDASVAAELTRAEIEGRRDTAALVAYYTRHLPGFESARLLHTSTQIGVRETRRLQGVYTLTGNDVRGGTRCDDGIALGCWPIDVHPASGEVGVHAMWLPLPYVIPYRCLLPVGVADLIVAGRCLSADREALGSARVGATCAATGHAAGVAAALAARLRRPLAELDIAGLRDRLRAQSAIVDPP
jgi:hypothetical protein